MHIFLDGGNFHHHALKRLGVPESGFDFERFARFLGQSRPLSGKRYYVGTVRERVGDPRSREAMARQTRLLTKLHTTGWEIKTSKLRRRLERLVIDERVRGYKEILQKGITAIEYERFREKGIDVKLATDLIVGAVDNRYDTAVIVSSDSDLIPAIDWVRFRMKRRIEYVGFSDNPTRSLMQRSDGQKIIKIADLRGFCDYETHRG